MRRIAQDDGFSLMPGKNCQRMTEHLQSSTLVPDVCNRGSSQKRDPGSFLLFVVFSLSLCERAGVREEMINE